MGPERSATGGEMIRWTIASCKRHEPCERLGGNSGGVLQAPTDAGVVQWVSNGPPRADAMVRWTIASCKRHEPCEWLGENSGGVLQAPTDAGVVQWVSNGPPRADAMDHCELQTPRALRVAGRKLWRRATSPNGRGCSSMVERQLPKLHTRVRFPSPAPILSSIFNSQFYTRFYTVRSLFAQLFANVLLDF